MYKKIIALFFKQKEILYIQQQFIRLSCIEKLIIEQGVAELLYVLYRHDKSRELVT